MLLACASRKPTRRSSCFIQARIVGLSFSPMRALAEFTARASPVQLSILEYADSFDDSEELHLSVSYERCGSVQREK